MVPSPLYLLLLAINLLNIDHRLRKDGLALNIDKLVVRGCNRSLPELLSLHLRLLGSHHGRCLNVSTLWHHHLRLLKFLRGEMDRGRSATIIVCRCLKTHLNLHLRRHLLLLHHNRWHTSWKILLLVGLRRCGHELWLIHRYLSLSHLRRLLSLVKLLLLSLLFIGYSISEIGTIVREVLCHLWGLHHDLPALTDYWDTWVTFHDWRRPHLLLLWQAPHRLSLHGHVVGMHLILLLTVGKHHRLATSCIILREDWRCGWNCLWSLLLYDENLRIPKFLELDFLRASIVAESRFHATIYTI